MFDEKELVRYIINRVLNIIYPYEKIDVDTDYSSKIITLPKTEESAKKVEYLINSYPKVLRFLRNSFGITTESTFSKSDDKVKITATYTKQNSKYNNLLIRGLLEHKFRNIPDDYLCIDIGFFVLKPDNNHTIVEAKLFLTFYKRVIDFSMFPVPIFEIILSINRQNNENFFFDLKIVEEDVSEILLRLGVRALIEIYSKLAASLFELRKHDKPNRLLELYANKVLGISEWKLAKEEAYTMNTREYMTKLLNFVKNISEKEEFQYLKPLVALTDVLGIEFLELVHKNQKISKDWLSLE